MGKSNVLAAIWMLLDRGAPPPTAGDRSRGGADPIRVSATLAGGDEVWLETMPPARPARSGRSVAVLFLPASERSGRLIAETGGADSASVAQEFFSPSRSSSAAPAVSLVGALERLCESPVSNLLLLVEEPELFLRPTVQRYLYRLLRTFTDAGNQVLYSTHSPAFLNVGRLDELALVEYRSGHGTTVVHPEPLPADASFRAVSEVDAERSELFLARAVLLVEGRTEKLSFPFVFRVLGIDPDREEIAIVECGGKPNLPLFVRICESARIPYVVVHDRDAAPGRKPILGERVLNAQIEELAGAERTVVLAPDFEAVAGLRGHAHKPGRAWEHFSSIEGAQVPGALRSAVETVVAFARSS